MPPYQYQPLNKGLKELRLLTLQPGDFSSELRISLQTVPFTPEDLPIYEALSYVWGSTENPVDIGVGASGNDTISITQNLAVALPYLRYADRVRRLWIDAICINQKDLDERSSQVKMMGDIFRLADRVIIWLGTERDNSTHILKILRQLDSQIHIDYDSRAMSPASAESDPRWSDPNKPLPLSEKELNDLESLLHRSWFSRLWVWQEAQLANKNAIMMCGSYYIPWQPFNHAIICVGLTRANGSLPSADYGRLRARSFDIMNMSEPQHFIPFGDNILRFASCGCSDPKDRIYAVLSLFDKGNGLMIEPDYKKKTGQVYQDVVLRYVEQRGDLDVLRYCQIDESVDMPTWVPNWDVANPIKSLWGNGRACGVSKAIAAYKGGGTLMVTGVISATIIKAQEIVLQDNHYETVIEEIRRIAPPRVEDSIYVSGGSQIDAFVSTLCASTFYHTTRPPLAQWPKFNTSWELVVAVLGNKDLDPACAPATDKSSYLEGVITYSKGRSFIITKEGHMGLAPKTARPGDQICVLLGCEMPLVLRPTSDGQYKAVGECYVHGLHGGEAFLGPLPEHYQSVLIWDQGYLPAFVNDQTGKVEYEDPRLEKADWGMGENARVRLRNGTETLRLTPNMLRRRGINVQSIDLI